ncbi:hypothetical protein MES5069_740063 [Mesorhizobium escarrei]|uniref:Uncharacterized protein n=1 Tax=Mesorhizobium escarrei TaxID=666018 RepID=A0ABM9EHR0_9HYPH|nr:hypothetical protein MES5069_740063 [Mesorhizobium escarrei]
MTIENRRHPRRENRQADRPPALLSARVRNQVAENRAVEVNFARNNQGRASHETSWINAETYLVIWET